MKIEKLILNAIDLVEEKGYTPVKINLSKEYYDKLCVELNAYYPSGFREIYQGIAFYEVPEQKQLKTYKDLPVEDDSAFDAPLVVEWEKND